MWGENKFTDYYGHAWPMCATSPQCENIFGMPLVHHRAELAPGMFKDGPFYGVLSLLVIFAKFCLHVLSHWHVLSPCDKTYRKIHSVHGLSLFSSNILIHLSSSLDVCIGVRECARALYCVVLLSPIQIIIKMNLFCILGTLQVSAVSNNFKPGIDHNVALPTVTTNTTVSAVTTVTTVTVTTVRHSVVCTFCLPN